MHRLTIVVLFLFTLFIQFNQQEAASIYLPALDETEDRRSVGSASVLRNLWYNRLNDMQDSDQEDYVDHLLKRFSPESSPLRQRRRFGNTRYGRSLPDNRK
jgi:hypothetical protein